MWSPYILLLLKILVSLNFFLPGNGVEELTCPALLTSLLVRHVCKLYSNIIRGKVLSFLCITPETSRKRLSIVRLG